MIATSTLPTIVGGVPLRLRSVSVAVNRANFLFNPTNCGALSTDSLLTSTFGATKHVSSPFQVTNCSALAFKPRFTAATNALGDETERRQPAGDLLQGAHEANLRSVVASLPLQLPSRLTTLQKACPEATFAANPPTAPRLEGRHRDRLHAGAPGDAHAARPTSSHTAARRFPDLDLVLEGNGVRVILVGNTNIKNGITTSTFASIPDVPVSSFALDLPTGPNSALAASATCACTPLLMPTTHDRAERRPDQTEHAHRGHRLRRAHPQPPRARPQVDPQGAHAWERQAEDRRQGAARHPPQLLALDDRHLPPALERRRACASCAVIRTARCTSRCTSTFVPAKAGALRSAMSRATFNKPRRRSITSAAPPSTADEARRVCSSVRSHVRARAQPGRLCAALALAGLACGLSGVERASAAESPAQLGATTSATDLSIGETFSVSGTLSEAATGSRV